MLNRKIYIKSTSDSPRLDYILDFIFKQFFDCGYELARHFDEKTSIINYSQRSQNDKSIWIKDSAYLSGEAILPKPESIDPDLDSFDLFAFVFYFLSRAEEYNFEGEDPFGRFSSADATFGQLVGQPMIDIHLLKLADQINDRFNIQLNRKSSFKLIHTVDIDQFYAFKNKSLKRTVGGLVSSALKANITDLKHRTKSLTAGKDPYDTFDFLQEHSENSDAYYFVLVGSYDKIDNALNIDQEEIKNQLLKLSQTAHIGIHPSIKSNESLDLLTGEKMKLESILSNSVTQSRQHFLKLHFPSTYHDLLSLNIEIDHSMGYHDAIGFRAGTSNAYYWFDLSKNQATDLLIQPLLAMDVTLKKYLKLDPKAAIDMTKDLIDQCKKVDAPFSLLWHNSSFYNREGWQGWKEVYLAIINYCQELST